MEYATASTRRSPDRPGRQAQWLPAGTAHAVMARVRGAGHHDVTMCGRATKPLHLFETVPFLSLRTCDDCPDCKAWVQGETRRLVRAAFSRAADR